MQASGTDARKTPRLQATCNDIDVERARLLHQYALHRASADA
jgi:hypothetical protein